jgi:hypothetical protein
MRRKNRVSGSLTIYKRLNSIAARLLVCSETIQSHGSSDRQTLANKIVGIEPGQHCCMGARIGERWIDCRSGATPGSAF